MAPFLVLTVFVLALTNVKSQNALCIVGRLDGLKGVNGLYTYAGEHNNYPYYTKQSHSNCAFDGYTLYFYWSAGKSRWHVNQAFDDFSYYMKCESEDATGNITTDPFKCNPYWDFASDTYDTDVDVIPDACPEWECDEIISTMTDNECGGPFSIKIASNTWQIPGGRYWIWYDEYQQWRCTDNYDLDCAGNYYAKTVSSSTWIPVISGGNVNLEYDYPNSGTYNVQCNKITTTSPTNQPSQEPSQFPSKSPTNNPSIHPSFNPTKYTTISPTTTIPTQNPSILPSFVPTFNPTATITTEDASCVENSALITITFDYELPNDYTTDVATAIIYNVTNRFVGAQISNIQNCMIYRHDITDVNIKPDNKHAKITILLCTTCTADTVKNAFVKDVDKINDNVNNILVVDTSTADISVDIVNKPDGELMNTTDGHTTQSPIDNSRDDEDTGDPFWAIMGILLALICIMIAIVGICIARKIKNDNVDLNSLPSLDNIDNAQKKEDTGTPENESNLDADSVEPGNVPIGLNKEIIMSDDEKYIDADDMDDIDNMERVFTENGDLRKKRVDHKNDTELVKKWLSVSVKFPQYYDIFIKNGYESLDIIKEIEGREELKEIGIELRGHQTKLLAEIRKLRQFEENNVEQYKDGSNDEMDRDIDVETINKGNDDKVVETDGGFDVVYVQ